MRRALATDQQHRRAIRARRCPECAHGILSIIEATTLDPVHPGYHVKGRALPVRERACIVAACNACEFVCEITDPRAH